MAELEDDLELDKAVVFAIFMGHGDGLNAKSPKYVMEKWRAVQGCVSRMEAISHLDVYGQRIFFQWRESWFHKSVPFDGFPSVSDPSNEGTKQVVNTVSCQIHGYWWCYAQEDGSHVGIGACNCASFPTEECKVDLHRLAAIERATTGHRTIGAG